MLLVTFITLFTVRIALKTLGIEDYGIYNVVAGVVTLMAFISNSMQTATLRFYSCAIGEKDPDKQNAVFNTSLLIYLIIAIAVVVLAETAGLWFLKNKIVIPGSRFNAALWIYQFAILSFVITILSIPFSSMVIAHENMKLYAMISLVDCILKLLILFPIMIIPYDRLFMYGLLLLAATVLKESISIIYCKRKYEECFFRFSWNKDLFNSIFSYSGWSLLGTIAGIAHNQGNNILINIFFGPAANAARAIAFQVSGAMTTFSYNLFTVIRPPLIKSYAEKNYNYMMKLFYLSSKFSYCLSFVIFLPLLLETEYILNLWLDNVSEYMVVFTRLTLISSLILSMHSPLTTLVQATGKVKKYFITVESATLLSLPLTYLFFKLDYSAETTFYISIFAFTVAHILRVLVLKSVIEFSLKEYFRKFIFQISVITVLSFIISFYLYSLFSYGFYRFIIVLPLSVLAASACSFLFGFNKKEKQLLSSFLKRNNYKNCEPI
jgi:O-antigen/teichoic acid export membrane protein